MPKNIKLIRQSICHPERKELCKGLCRNCYEKELKKLNPLYAERQKENSKKWHIKNKKYKSEYDKKRRELVGPETEKRFFKYIFKKFNITKEEYELFVEKSNNLCNICGRPPHKNKKLHLDHCHSTGKVRGLLCTRCNWYLSTIEKNPKILEIIKQYLNYE